MTKIKTFRCVMHKPGDYHVIPLCKQGGILGKARGAWKLAELIKEHGLEEVTHVAGMHDYIDPYPAEFEAILFNAHKIAEEELV